ncbi:hypothetical protein [Nostoc sp.]
MIIRKLGLGIGDWGLVISPLLSLCTPVPQRSTRKLQPVAN